VEIHDFPEYRDELRAVSKELAGKIPEVYAGFRRLSGAAHGEGALSAKHKELQALAISIAVRCDGCISAHVHGAVKGGATAEEIAETIGVAISMGGGPSTVYGAHAWAAYRQYAAAGAAAGETGG
jgi:AhpD family alkylhydroperoxidase